MENEGFAQDLLGRVLLVGDAVLCPSSNYFTVKYVAEIRKTTILLEWSTNGNRYTKAVYKPPKHGMVSNVLKLTNTERDVVYTNL